VWENMVRFGYSVDVGKSIETEKTGEKLSAERIQKEIEEQEKKEQKPAEEKAPEKPAETEKKEEKPEPEEPKEEKPEPKEEPETPSESKKEEKPEEKPSEPEKKEEPTPKYTEQERKEEVEEIKENLKVKSISFDKAELIKDVQKPIDENEEDVNEIVQEHFESSNKQFKPPVKKKSSNRLIAVVCILAIIAIGAFFFINSESPEQNIIVPQNTTISLAEPNITEEIVVLEKNTSVEPKTIDLSGLALSLKD